MVLQVADVGVKKFIKRSYCREYTATMCANSLTMKSFDDTERIGCVVRTVMALERESKLITSCFRKCGLLSGYKEVHRHFVPSIFAAGRPLRDTNLPVITKE